MMTNKSITDERIRLALAKSIIACRVTRDRETKQIRQLMKDFGKTKSSYRSIWLANTVMKQRIEGCAIVAAELQFMLDPDSEQPKYTIYPY